MTIFFLLWVTIACLAIASIPFLPLIYSSIRLWNQLSEKRKGLIKGWAMIISGAIIILLSLALLVLLIMSCISGDISFGMCIFGLTLYSIFAFPFCIYAICDGVFQIKNPIQEDSKNNNFTKTKLFDKLMTPYIFYFAMLISVGWLYGAYQVFLVGEREDDVIYYIISLAMLLGYIGLLINIIIERRKNARKANKI